MKKLVTLLLMALMVTGLHAQTKSELPNVTLKNLNGKDVNIAKLNNNGNPIVIDDSRSTAKVKPTVEGKGWDFDVLLDVNSDLKRAMNVSNPPHTFLFDGNGKLVYQHTGYIEGGEEDLYEEILKVAKTKKKK